jgi:hypothetical protein
VEALGDSFGFDRRDVETRRSEVELALEPGEGNVARDAEREIRRLRR